MTNTAMKAVLLALVGCLIFGHALLAADDSAVPDTAATPHPSTPDVKTALDAIISQQLAAFADHDFPKAYSYAAAEIQKLFKPDIFEKMVRSNYGIMLLKPKVDFGVALDDGQDGIVFVELTGSDGPEVFRYMFKKEATGWKISGVEQVEKIRSGKPPLSA